MLHNPHLKTVRSPYEDGEELLAMPAITLDVALCHVSRADAAGNGQILGPDPFFDDLFCGAAKKRFVSAEAIVPTEQLLQNGGLSTLKLNRTMVDGVVEAKRGAHFTSNDPDYARDEVFQKEYAAAAADPQTWNAFYEKWMRLSHEAYLAALEAR
jgi:glutaconate CoA-transferase, subunit A